MIAAEYSGANVKVDTSFKVGETNKSADFQKKFPLGKVPAFESKDGDCIFESNAIAHFVGNSQLQGSTPKDAAYIQQWINFADNEILPASCTWVFPCLGITQYNKQETDRAKEQLKTALSVLNQYLETRTFLVGERISQADITVVCDLLLAYQYVLEPAFRQSYVNTNRWFTTLINQPNFKKVIGDFRLCEKMAQFDGKKYADLHGGDKKKKEAKPQQKKEQQAPKPKQEKKKKEEDDEDDDDIPREEDKKDPFSKFPKGTFDFDAFKREYSNKDTLTEALPYFWEHIDKQNYTIWHCKYKYPEELAQVWMTCNLVGGMFQRIDKMRKNSFGSMCIFGEDNKTEIEGIWVWKGDELAFELSPNWSIDYESYSWKNLDINAPETKKMVQEFFAWEGSFDGKTFNQGKIFK